MHAVIVERQLHVYMTKVLFNILLLDKHILTRLICITYLWFVFCFSLSINHDKSPGKTPLYLLLTRKDLSLNTLTSRYLYTMQLIGDMQGPSLKFSRLLHHNRVST